MLGPTPPIRDGVGQHSLFDPELCPEWGIGHWRMAKVGNFTKEWANLCQITMVDMGAKTKEVAPRLQGWGISVTSPGWGGVGRTIDRR